MHFLFFTISYLIGSIPFGAILTYISGNGNIRNIGSGNIGATNVLRTGNKKIAALTLFLDSFKGFIVIAILKYYGYAQEVLYMCSLFVVIGHMFPLWFSFKGGKGVATFLGVLAALNFYIALIFIVTWILIFFIFRYSSLSSIIATLFSLLVICYYSRGEVIMISIVIVLLILVRHYTNIKRLLRGEEYKFNKFW